MNEKESIWGYLIAFIIVAVLGFCVYWFFLRSDGNSDLNKNTTQNDNTSQTQENDKNNTKDSTSNTTDDVTDDQTKDSDTTTDFSDFSSNDQSIGKSKSSDTFTISSLSNSAMTGYHHIAFTLTPDNDDSQIPYVTAKYNSSLGAIRLNFSKITKDSTGLGYQKSTSINTQGVIKIYHNISSDQTEELYDIGISAQTVFKLDSSTGNDGTYLVTLDVKYPGGEDSQADLGSTDFSKDAQSITGATSSDKAKVLSYSYSNSAGVLTIAFNVSGSTSNPIPSVSAKIKNSNMLEVTFTDVVTDAVYSALNNKKLGNLNVTTSRTGNKSVYTFDGVKNEYKLSGTKSPNQVILEIKL